MKVRIRKFRKEDAKHCSRIGIQNFLKYIDARSEKGYLRNRRDWFDYFKVSKIIEMSQTTRQIRIATDENENVIGFGSYELMDDKAEIAMMFVEADRHEGGIGKSILEHMLNEIKESGRRKVDLFALLMAEGFYQKQGFIHDHDKDEMRKRKKGKKGVVDSRKANKFWRANTLRGRMGQRYGYYMHKEI